MTCCPGCEERDEKIRQLERELYAEEYWAPVELGLSLTHNAMLGMLVRYSLPVAHETMWECTRGPQTLLIDYDPVVMKVQMCRLRQKLAPHGLQIETIRGFGWRLHDDSRARLLNWTARRAA